jgi:glycine/D-amino acid oxidase-like deaminating enzyme/nitrite reductase/ring-hydroxylating ferredoxin subunit
MKERAVNVGDELTRSLWADTDVAQDVSPLKKNEKADVAVIGGGIAGLSTAYELATRGLDVVVIDRGQIGKGMTARTTAHLSPICDDGFGELAKIRGAEMAALFFESQAAAIDRIEEIVSEHNIACNFRRLDAFLFPGPNSKQSELDDEMRAAKRAGADAAKVRGVPFEGLRDSGCIKYPNQAAFHPLRYLRGLAEQLTKAGARLYSDTSVTGVIENGGAVTVKAGNRAISAAAAVVATNSPINDRVALHTKMAPYRTYAMAFTLPKDILPDALYWDMMDPYHYVRLQTGPGSVNYLIVGGADHKSGEADDADARYDALEAWMRGLLPALGKETHRWSGQVLEPIDYVSFTGRNPGEQNIYVHTGDSGQGITHGAMAGMLIADLITEGDSPWAGLYEPSRKPAKAAVNFARENATVVKNFCEYVAAGELSSIEEIAPGHGAIVREGMHKIAAYRDEKGKLHKFSAACTHLGCLVHWNSLEHCWDCPCHGSQFAPDGTALNGPAVSALERVD